MESTIIKNISEKREFEYSEIITIPANTTKVLNLNNIEGSPFINCIMKSLGGQIIKFYLNNSTKFKTLIGGEISIFEAGMFREIKFQNDNAVDIDISLEFDNNLTLLEIEKVKLGVMKYGTKN